MRNWNFGHIDFSVYPFYDGVDLGVCYTPHYLSVKIWAPTAQHVELSLYERSSGGKAIRKEMLHPQENGSWHLQLDGDWNGFYYTFRVNDGDWLNETPGPDARAVGANGKRGLIFDPNETNPKGWENDRRVKCETPVDAILYELHVRDFSISESSGMRNKGKFLAFTEKETYTVDGFKTGISHLKELGVTHVHLLPVADYFTVDENHPDQTYNWGYDPLNYNAPEGSYSSDPDTISRIKEFKSLVQSLHRDGIGVILDVVYNHTGYTRRSYFNQTVPGYYYRQKSTGTFSNASGCGNEIASERAMVRKYIVDSLRYWAIEFHLDGFRFDLMGILDLDTMNIVRNEMNMIDPSILLYGEGWAADKSPLSEEFRAVKTNASRLDGISVFNDDFRDGIKGNNFDSRSKGFVSGRTLQEEKLKFGIVGASYHPQIVYDYVESSVRAWASNPWQSVNYVSCHDNFTLYDKLVLSCPEATADELQKMVMLSGAILLTSQGIPFLHAGMEMLRTKLGEHNSYRSSDKINQIDWSRKGRFHKVVQYFQSLIEMRKEHPAFRMSGSDQVQKHLSFSEEYQTGVVAYSIVNHANDDPWRNIWVVFNGNKHDVMFDTESDSLKRIVAENGTIDLKTERTVKANISVFPISMTILVED